jgi:type IV secretory pathway VirB10-like protein
MNCEQKPRLDDPRAAIEQFDEPVVGAPFTRASYTFIAGGFIIAAGALFLLLNSRRTAEANALVSPPKGIQIVTAAPPPLDIPAPPPPPPPVPGPLEQVDAVPRSLPAPRPPDDTPDLHAPSVVIDLQSAPLNGPSAPPLGSVVVPAAQAAPLSPVETFAAKASQSTPDASVAIQIGNLTTTITQGATIPGVLETAIDSDLPGFTRAVVSRDVRGFDGKAVLIPRGSRIVGQYQNALALGQARVFVVWTRIIRPDGVSIQIASPGGDALGRGGLTGDVNSHFFARFGGAILLSLLNAGSVIAAGVPSTEISIGSPQAAAGAAAGATIPQSSDIMPTIKVVQGSPINIFVARDLDFSGVKQVLAE